MIPPDEDPPRPKPEADSEAESVQTGTRRRSLSVFAPGGLLRRFAKLWGFLGFCILVLVLTRSVILPFVFALLIAYILAPLVRRMSTRMPRGVAILVCYLVLISAVGVFVTALLPRIAKDVARIGREAPALYKRVNEEHVPALAAWLEE